MAVFHEKHGTTSDRVSVVINSILAILTILAIYFSYQANKTSQLALLHQVQKDSVDAIEQTANEIIRRDEREYNRRFIDSSLEVNRKYANAMERQADASQRGLSLAEVNAKAAMAQVSASQRALILAEVNAEAAMKQVNQNEKNALFYEQSVKAENRADIVVDSILLKEMPEQLEVRLTLKITNVGKTPAKNIRLTYILLGPNEKTDTGFEKLYPHNEGSGTVSSGVHSEIYEKIKCIMVTTTGKKIFAGALSIENGSSIFIKIAYKDIFETEHEIMSGGTVFPNGVIINKWNTSK